MLHGFDQIQCSKWLEREASAKCQSMHDMDAESAEKPVGSVPVQRCNDAVVPHLAVEAPGWSSEEPTDLFKLIKIVIDIIVERFPRKRLDNRNRTCVLGG